jgi:radical SAM superfamily enzyme YgiQ (UPF0313 family)
MTQKPKCLLVSFNFSKEEDGYPSTSYQIASILAQFRKSDFIDIELFDYDMNRLLIKTWPEYKGDIITSFEKEYKDRINEYSFIGLSVYAWSEDIVKQFIKMIRNSYNFEGKLILGGYEITARDEAQLEKEYPGADYYVKGYAEKSFEKIFRNEAGGIVLYEPVEGDKLESPYLSGILPLDTGNIYWETKRGCQYKCDFCEWGSAARESSEKGKLIRIGPERLDAEIDLFKKKNIKQINILDASFISSARDMDILEKLLAIQDCEIVLQAHFELMKNAAVKNQFFNICKKYRDRISLEFGLQTIIEEEMRILARKNDLDHIKKVMAELNEQEITYEISIIYGIPGQTADTFKKTIRFIVGNGCKKFRAFPLRLPYNSEMRKQAKKSGLSEGCNPDNPLIPVVQKTRKSALEELDEYLSTNKGATSEDWSKTYKSLLRTQGADPYDDYRKMYRMARICNQGIVYRRDKISPDDISNIIDDYFNSYSFSFMFSFDGNPKNELRMFISEYLRDSEAAKMPYIDLMSLTPFVPAIQGILEAIRKLYLKEQNLEDIITERIINFIDDTYGMIFYKLKLGTDDIFKEEESLLKEFKWRIEEVIRDWRRDLISDASAFSSYLRDLIWHWPRQPMPGDIMDSMLNNIMSIVASDQFVTANDNFDKTQGLIKRVIEETYEKINMAYDEAEKRDFEFPTGFYEMVRDSMLNEIMLIIDNDVFDKAYYLIKRFMEETYKGKLSVAYDEAKKYLECKNDNTKFKGKMRDFIDEWRDCFLKKQIEWMQNIIEARQEEFFRQLKADLKSGRA